MSSRFMRTIKTKNTKPEPLLRRELHSCGVRYRLNTSDLLGKTGLGFWKYKLAVYANGDTWHGNEHIRRGLPNLEGIFPARANFCFSVIRANIGRDMTAIRLLESAGWAIFRFWASEVQCDPSGVAMRIDEYLTLSKTRCLKRTGGTK